MSGHERNSETVANNNNTLMTIPQGMKAEFFTQELVLEELFGDVKPNVPMSGTRCGITIEQLRCFNFGIEKGRILFHEIFKHMSLVQHTPEYNKLKLAYRAEILSLVDDCIESGVCGKFYQSNGFRSYPVTNRERAKVEIATALSRLDSYALRNGKIGLTNYEIKFSFRSNQKCTSEDDVVLFIDSEGCAFPLNPLKSTDEASGVILAEGIYVSKITPNSAPDQPYIVLPLPTMGEPTKSDILNGVFFSSVTEFKDIYKTEYKSTYSHNLPAEERAYNIKKLVGKFLYNGITETSHGLVSLIVGYSLTRNSFWTCSHEYGVVEIKNITSNNTSDIDFTNALNEIGLTREHLAKSDYIVRKTNVGSGSGKVSAQNTRIEKIRISRKSGISEIHNSIMDSDLTLFNETGVAIFSSKDAAERCMKFADGDVEKYVKYISSKTVSKDEKSKFVDSMKSAALVGAGAAIPKIVEFAIKQSRPVAEAAVSMGLMKTFLPPIAASHVRTFGVVGFIGPTIGIATKVIPLIGGALLGYSIYNYMKETKVMGAIGNFFSNVFNGIKSLFGINSGAGFVETVKSIGVAAWNGVKKSGIFLWEGAKNLFNWVKSGVQSFYNNLEGGTFIEKTGGFAKKVWEGTKSIAIKSWEIAKTAGAWAVDAVKSAWSWISGGLRSVFA